MPGDQIRLVSTTKDEKKSVVFAASDINPGTYYIYQADENKLKFLFHARKDIDYRIMAETKPISFKARDGLEIHGYLTLPFGKDAKNLPLVVMPHGGPMDLEIGGVLILRHNYLLIEGSLFLK